MISTAEGLVLFAAVITLGAVQCVGWRILLPIAVIFSTCLIVRPILYPFGRIDFTGHTGVAGEVPRIISTALVVLTVTLMWLLLGKFYQFPFAFLPLMVFLAIGYATEWGGTTQQQSGILNYVVAAAAWWIGTVLAKESAWHVEVLRSLSGALLAVMTMQTAISMLQAAGTRVFSVDPETLLMVGNRANGTLGHPANLGKMIVLAAILLLPMTMHSDPITRRLSRLALAVSVFPLLFSQGRANIAGFVLLIGVWGVWSYLIGRFGRTLHPARSATIVVCCVIVGYYSVRILNERNAEDPFGGSRSRFSDVALEVIPDVLAFGIGPNSYVDYVGQFDALTGAGWPVHNFFLLTTVEIGIVGLILLLLPIIIGLGRACRHVKSRTGAGDNARALIASLAGLYFIATTGWGLALEYVLPLWFFVTAFCIGRIRIDSLESRIEAVELCESNTVKGEAT